MSSKQFLRFSRSIWRAKFFVQTFIIDLVWTGCFSFLHKNTFCVLRFPRSITHWIGFGLGWFGKFNTWCFSKRLLNEFPTGRCSTVEPNWSFLLFQLWSYFNEIFGGGRKDKKGLWNKTSPVFNLTLLECNKLEVSLEEKLHSIVFDRMLIYLWSQD